LYKYGESPHGAWVGDVKHVLRMENREATREVEVSYLLFQNTFN
jgi:hypothetical protein